MNRTKPTFDVLVNDAAVVYSLPILYDRLMQAINHPRSSITDITRIICNDQGLSARILKLANSPRFGYHAKIDSITEAVTIVGTQQLSDLALAVSVIEIFDGIPGDMFNMTAFWQHSITCAIVARSLAICRRETNTERYFLTGMLHDIGQLILCTKAPGFMRETITESATSGQPLFELQRAELGFDHGEVGGALLNLWRIPASITEAVTWHHAPGRAELYPTETAAMHVADIIAHALQSGFSGESYIPALHEAAWDQLDIPPSMLAIIIKQTDEQLNETMEILYGSGLNG
jgi:HD-like signal output (HDOD) protein